MPRRWEITTNHWYYSRTSTFLVAHTGIRCILLEENGVGQPNPPMVNMLKIVNHIGANKGSQEKHFRFPINVDPRGPYKHHLVVRVDIGADVNCINEKTFKRLFPKVKLSVCPHEIQNFGNSVADISILEENGLSHSH